MPTVPKEVIRPGTYWYREEGTGKPRKLVVTPELTRYWHDQGNAMLGDGLTIPVPFEHDFNAHPMTPAEKLKNNAGWVEGYSLKDNKLYANVGIEDKDVAKKLPGTIRWTSPWINSFTDGNGKNWRNVISHLALTTRPRIVEQEPFGSVAAALSMAEQFEYSNEVDVGKGLCLSNAGLLEGDQPLFPIAFSAWSGGIAMDLKGMSLENKRSYLNKQLMDRFKATAGPGEYVDCWITDLFDKDIVFNHKGKDYALGYTEKGGKCVLSDEKPKEVVRKTTYDYVNTEAAMATDAGGREHAEAGSDKGGQFVAKNKGKDKDKGEGKFIHSFDHKFVAKMTKLRQMPAEEDWQHSIRIADTGLHRRYPDFEIQQGETREKHSRRVGKLIQGFLDGKKGLSKAFGLSTDAGLAMGKDKYKNGNGDDYDDDDMDYDDDDDMPDDGDDSNDDNIDLEPFDDPKGDVSATEVLADLLGALGIQVELSGDEAQFKRELYNAAMTKIHELTNKGEGKPDPQQPNRANPPGQPPNKQQPGQGQQQNPLIQQEQQPMYMSLEEINRMQDGPTKTVALSFYNENAKLHQRLEAAEKRTGALQAAKLAEAQEARRLRVDTLCRIAPNVKDQLESMLSVDSMALSLGDDGEVVDPMEQTLAVLESSLSSIPTLLRTDAASLAVQKQPSDKDQIMSAEKEDQLADSLAKSMGVVSTPPKEDTKKAS